MSVIICEDCDHEVPCYHMDAHGRSHLDSATEASRKQPVLRCPNSDDSCTYPNCNHIAMKEKETEMVNINFDRKTKGDPIDALRDLFSHLTYDEMLLVAKGISADPAKINAWAKGQTHAGVSRAEIEAALNNPPTVIPAA